MIDAMKKGHGSTSYHDPDYEVSREFNFPYDSNESGEEMPDNPGYPQFPHSHDAAAATGRAADSRRRVAALDAFRCFHKMLLTQRAIQEGRLPQPKGYFVGDGVPRTLDGTPFEPLSGWDHLGRKQ